MRPGSSVRNQAAIAGVVDCTDVPSSRYRQLTGRLVPQDRAFLGLAQGLQKRITVIGRQQARERCRARSDPAQHRDDLAQNLSLVAGDWRVRRIVRHQPDMVG